MAKVAGHAKAGKRCKKCGKVHSKSAHWSHAKNKGRYNFAQTPRPEGRKTAAGNPSRAVTPGKRRPKGMTKAEAKRQRQAMAGTKKRGKKVAAGGKKRKSSGGKRKSSAGKRRGKKR